MNRHGDLWPALTAWPNLLLAAAKARRRKRHRPAVQRFEFRREFALLALRRDLLAGSFTPGQFVTHWVHTPKRRLISAAPYPDRVLHHAVMNVLEPILERNVPSHSFACRTGKGTLSLPLHHRGKAAFFRRLRWMKWAFAGGTLHRRTGYSSKATSPPTTVRFSEMASAMMSVVGPPYASGECGEEKGAGAAPAFSPEGATSISPGCEPWGR